MENKINLTTKILISGISIFFILLLISGFTGLYTVKNSYTKTSRYIEAINLARESQIYFQKQFYLWNMIFLQGESIPEFKANYHSFTFYADRVQDTLFNLKLLCSDFKSIPNEIGDLRSMHKKMTMEYIVMISKLMDTGFKNRKVVISDSREKNDAAIFRMDKLVLDIGNVSDEEIKNVNSRYFYLALSAFILITFSFIASGVYIAFKILNIHKELDRRIFERTAELSKANTDLKAEIQERIKAEESLNEANKRISLSEMKYRHLVDTSNDIIFSLYENWNFITANKALSTHLKIRQDSVKTLNLLTLLGNNTNGRAVTSQLIKEKLENFLKDKEPISFIGQFTSIFASEPKEMNVKLEYIKVEDTYEIHGIISPMLEDNLLKYFVSERQRYEIPNYLTMVEDITYNIVKNLRKYMNTSEVSILRMGLREMIFNAIEHGNLEITYEEKTEALMNDTYRKLIEKRREKADSAGKKVVIEYQIDDSRAVFKIVDSGRGFDHKKAMSRNMAEQNNDSIPHGRGILMSKEIFNEIKYNDKGNQVLLVKTFGNAQLN